MSRVVQTAGIWLIAGTWAHAQYPCQCHRRKGKDCRTKWCPCWGRDDLVRTASRCCAPKHPKHAKEPETA